MIVQYIDNIQYPPWYLAEVLSICLRPKAEGKYGTGYCRYPGTVDLHHTVFLSMVDSNSRIRSMRDLIGGGVLFVMFIPQFNQSIDFV